jgi:DNA mismatch repair protein MutL
VSAEPSRPRIRQLDHTVVTKIAAGEVIERPASVVKELLENSLDAGAARIDVEVDQGGLDTIRVVDDGCGILPEDLPLVFASHATSKLRDADDLFRIGTLGFRGEAMASVGGVAQVGLQSRPKGHPSGAEITCHGGTLSRPKAWNGSLGTRIEVRHLFFNTPVRRKFLRTVQTEMGHVCEVFTRLALSHPRVHWTLRHGGKLVYEVPASAGLADRVRLFFGADVQDRLYAIDTVQGQARLFGYVADPSCDRGNARTQYLFLNGRWIRDRSLGHAIQEAYRGLLMVGRYAVSFLFLELPPDHVDVNVHPTKCEVRFRDGHAVYHLVFGAVRERLRAENLTGKLQAPTAPQPTTPPPVELWSMPPRPDAVTPPPASFSREPAVPAGRLDRHGSPDSSASATVSDRPPESTTPALAEDVSRSEPPPARPPMPVALKALQLYDAYLVVETPEGMLVIDQHALHERVLFEQLKARVRSGPLPAQRLLIPEPVELSADQAARLLEQRDELAELGLEVSDFGGGTVLLSSYPAILGHRSPGEALKAVVDHLMTKERMPPREVLFNDLLSLMACHGAVRSGDRLTPEEIEALVAMRHLADDTHHCPLFSKNDLARQFGRI